MGARDIAQEWLDNVEDDSLRLQLEALFSEDASSELEDAFFQELSFGTAGLRAVIGPGTNRMNIYTVGKATQGLANYINDNFAPGAKVAIARDSRHEGELFVRRAASVLAANGIEACIYPRIEPTPALSFAVRDIGCAAGICMTASHNPAEYNGYKVYGPDGCQITSHAARAISGQIADIDAFSGVKSMDFDAAIASGLASWIPDDTLERYIDAVASCSLRREEGGGEDISVVYTPLCGTGLECLSRAFERIGAPRPILVEEQSAPNGDFPTCPYPNPETREALQKGMETCKEAGARLLMATDPDADRIGIAVAHQADYVLPTGNEIGILLLDYICTVRESQGTMPPRPLVASTIVSTAMIDAIAAEHGVEVRRTLTGFKYLGDIVTKLESEGCEENFLLGFEESYGYLTGTHVRDKDALNAAVLIYEMAQYHQKKGLDLAEALDALYRSYGYYANRTVNMAFPGVEGARTMKTLMEHLRTSSMEQLAGRKVMGKKDYLEGIEGLPEADVVEFMLEDELKVIFRPSGTEPKIKAYLFAKADSAAGAQSMLDELEKATKDLL